MMVNLVDRRMALLSEPTLVTCNSRWSPYYARYALYQYGLRVLGLYAQGSIFIMYPHYAENNMPDDLLYLEERT